MKNRKFLWSRTGPRTTGISTLVLVLMFAACSNPNGSESNADKTALNSAITEAEALAAATKTSTNGADVPLGTQWVTSNDLVIFNNAITNAKKVSGNNSATQGQVDEARYALESAAAAFNAARKGGNATPVDRSALDALIAGAESAINGTIVAENANGAAQGAKWATQAQLKAIDAAIENTKNSTTQAEVTAALNALTNALETFTNAVSGNPSGTKTTGFIQAELDVLIAKANTAKERVTAAANEDDVPPTAFWVSEEDLNTLNNAVSEAGNLSDAAYLDLLHAFNEFNEIKKPGSLPDKTPLFTAIKGADTAREGVNIAAKKEEAPGGSAWVTQAQWNALETVYAAAVTAAGNANATKNAVAQTTTALNTAITTFITAKNSNGLGTAVNGITISGLGAVYTNGAAVYVGVAESKEVDLSSANPVQGTVTNGSLTVSPDIGNGSRYIGFSSDGIIAFISKTPVIFSGAMVSKAYPADFELYTWSLRLSDMGLDTSMALDTAVQTMSQGMFSNYADFKTAIKQMGSEIFGDTYANLNFLDMAYYKNAACTQEFSGTDIIGPDTVIYSKFSPVGLMNGGGEEEDAAGYMTGTVNFTGYTGQRPRIYIYAVAYPAGGDIGDSSSVKSNGSFSIPFSENFLTALQSEAQNITFDLWIEEPGSDGGYFKWGIKTLRVTASELSGNKLNVGSLGTVTLPSVFITLSATITVTYNGEPVPYVNIAVYGNNGLLGHIKTESPGPGKTWKLILPAFESPTDLWFPEVNAYSDGDWEGFLFSRGTGVTAPGVYNTDVTIPPINLGDITP